MPDASVVDTTVGPLVVRMLRNPEDLRTLEGLDALHQSERVQVTSRGPWLEAWLRHHRWARLLVVVVERDGEVRACAPLAARRVRGRWQVVPVGDGPSDVVRLPARDGDAADLLAVGIAGALATLGGAWTLRLRHLDPNERVLAPLRRQLQHSVVVPGEVSPLLHLGEDRTLRPYLSRNAYQQLRRRRNRLAREGVAVRLDVLRRPEDVMAALPEVIRVHRARDLQLGRASAVDGHSTGPFFSDLLVRLAKRGEMELVVLYLDERLAAYVVVLVDGPVRRMWNCRFDPAWSAYGPGRLALQTALESALADDSCQVFDWMRGTEEYKAQMSDDSWRAVDLHACSSPVVWAAQQGVRAGAEVLRVQRDRSPVLGRLWQRVGPRVDALRERG
jgi:CelD/BcsL family acetyltransferase involved in cellulose biosynthesis